MNIMKVFNLRLPLTFGIGNRFHQDAGLYSKIMQRRITPVVSARTLTVLFKSTNTQAFTDAFFLKQNKVNKTHISVDSQRRYFFEDRKTKSVAVWEDIKQVRSSPLPALVLGISGLIPFVIAPGCMILSHLYLPSIVSAQTTYGACILSFLGGVRWGIAVPDNSEVRPDWFNLGYSVTPSLIAWLGLLLPDTLSLFTIMIGLAGTAYFDSTLWGYPPWFKGLRFLLSLMAVLSLWTTFMCKLMLNTTNTNVTKIEAKPEEISNTQEE